MVTYTFTNGTVADASEVNQNFIEVSTKLYADNTGGSTGSTTETDLASTTIPQNDLSSSFKATVTAGIKVQGSESFQNTGTFRLYVGGVVVKTITVRGTTGSGSEESGSAFAYLSSELDSTSGDIEIKITGQNSNSGGDSYCEGLVVVGYNQ